MTCIEGLLWQQAGQIQVELQKALSGLGGFVVRGYLPQIWTIKSDSESTTLTVDSNGNVRVTAGGASRPDVTIEASHRLASAALSGDMMAAELYRDEARVTTHTQKGATAWEFLRRRLGF